MNIEKTKIFKSYIHILAEIEDGIKNIKKL